MQSIIKKDGCERGLSHNRLSYSDSQHRYLCVARMLPLRGKGISAML